MATERPTALWETVTGGWCNICISPDSKRAVKQLARRRDRRVGRQYVRSLAQDPDRMDDDFVPRCHLTSWEIS